MNVSEFADRLRARSVDVIVGRHLDPHASITVGDVDEVTDDKHRYLNDGRDGIYVERTGRVWLLGGGTAAVRVELPDAKSTVTQAQDVSVGVLLSLDKPYVRTSTDNTSTSGGATTVKPTKRTTKKAAAAKKA